MFWLFTDETNLEPNQGRFFIYGGLIMTPEQMIAAHEAISGIRSRYGFNGADSFKFHTRSRPAHITFQDWTSAKRDAISAAERIGAVLIIYVVLHELAKGKGKKETNLEWALNSVIAHFGLRYLPAKEAYGAVCLDRVPEGFGYTYLCQKFQGGVSLPDGRAPKLGESSITPCRATVHLTLVPSLTSLWEECAIRSMRLEELGRKHLRGKYFLRSHG